MPTVIPIITISSPKALSEADWKSIMGSPLHEAMFRNRCVLNVPANETDDYTEPMNTRVFKQITKWMAEHCNSFYYIERSPLKVYIERDSDVTMFMLAHNGQDAPAEPPSSASVPLPPSPVKSPLDLLAEEWQMKGEKT